MRNFGWWLVVLLCFSMAGCAHVMSQDSLKLVDRSLTFDELRRDPESYIGRYVLLGGTIAGGKNTKEKGELEVVQAPLDDSGMPKETQYSGGRFLVTAAQFLDPIVYKVGKRVAVVGEVKGKKTRMIDEVEYTYPVVASVEMHLWEKYEADRYYNYPPSYYYDPFWYPWWPYRPYPYWW